MLYFSQLRQELLRHSLTEVVLKIDICEMNPYHILSVHTWCASSERTPLVSACCFSIALEIETSVRGVHFC